MVSRKGKVDSRTESFSPTRNPDNKCFRYYVQFGGISIRSSYGCTIGDWTRIVADVCSHNSALSCQTCTAWLKKCPSTIFVSENCPLFHFRSPKREKFLSLKVKSKTKPGGKLLTVELQPLTTQQQP